MATQMVGLFLLFFIFISMCGQIDFSFTRRTYADMLHKCAGENSVYWTQKINLKDGLYLTSRLNAEVDLALGRMGDGIAAELHIGADKRKQEA